MLAAYQLCRGFPLNSLATRSSVSPHLTSTQEFKASPSASWPASANIASGGRDAGDFQHRGWPLGDTLSVGVVTRLVTFRGRCDGMMSEDRMISV
jgi:hypothetical protein